MTRDRPTPPQREREGEEEGGGVRRGESAGHIQLGSESSHTSLTIVMCPRDVSVCEALDNRLDCCDHL